MTVSQITNILSDKSVALPIESLIEKPHLRLNRIITDLENPVYITDTTKLRFHVISEIEDEGVLEVYSNGNEISYIIPFSTIYGFVLN